MKYYKHSLDAESIAHALDGKRTGKGFMCCCPAHDDRSPSLSITDSDNNILLHCFAGCTFEEITCALRGMGLWATYGVKVNKNKQYRYTEKEISYAKTVIKLAQGDIRRGEALSAEDVEEVRGAIKVLKYA